MESDAWTREFNRLCLKPDVKLTLSFLFGGCFYSLRILFWFLALFILAQPFAFLKKNIYRYWYSFVIPVTFLLLVWVSVVVCVPLSLNKLPRRFIELFWTEFELNFLPGVYLMTESSGVLRAWNSEGAVFNESFLGFFLASGKMQSHWKTPLHRCSSSWVGGGRRAKDWWLLESARWPEA